MRDYWLTQDLLQAAGMGYLLIVLGALAAVLWFARGKAMKALGAAVVLGLGSILPWKSYQEGVKVQQQVSEFQRRQAAARAVFDERCKTAGEKIYKTVEDVEGVYLPRVRERTGRADDPMTPEAAAWNEHSGNGYIIGLLLFAEPANNNPYRKSIVESRTRFPGFKFVEVSDKATGVRHRYTWTPEQRLQKIVSPAERPPRYAIEHEDIVNAEDRQSWVAGAKLKIVDTIDQSLLAELTYFKFESGLGSRSGHRDPWAFALACPNVPVIRPMHRYFADAVLRTNQKVQP
ncbi:hypothetical protein [Ramlibacter sp.]|uniref:hypothetical protein n=1 Tax=Ramlibacter sp. TaxID=1917967 RepID=UPI0035AD8E08